MSSVSIIVHQSPLSSSYINIAPAAVPTAERKTMAVATAIAFAGVRKILGLVYRTITAVGAAIRPAPEA